MRLRFGFRWPVGNVGAVVEEGLENEGGCHLVDDPAVLLPGAPGLVKELVSRLRSQPLVPKMNGAARELPQFLGKRADFLALSAHFTRKRERVADDDPIHPIAAGQPVQGTKVLAGIPSPGQRQHWLRGEAQFVRNGHADALGSDVKGKISGWYLVDQWITRFPA